MKLRLRRPRELATRLRALARLQPREVEEYLDTHAEEWEALATADPHDAADILEELGEEAALDLIGELPPADVADILEEMRPELAADLLEELKADEAADVLEAMDADEAADLIGELEPVTRAEVLDELEEAVAEEVLHLLTYPPDSAGGLMTTDIAVLPVGMTAGEAIEVVRRLHEELEDLSYVYITDDDGRLVGVLSFRELVFNRPGVGLDEVMIRNPVAVTPDTDREVVAELTQRYRLFGLPVVDEQLHLLGMVDTDSVLEAVREEASEDFAAAVGAGAQETVFTPVHRSVGNRLPWLALNLAMALLVMFVVERQKGIIGGRPILAALMPLVALLGGNGGAQSLAVVIRALATDDVPANRVMRVLGQQFLVGAFNGIAIGALAGLIVTGLYGGQVGWVVALAAWVNMSIATFAGSGIPFAFRGLGLDPALASNIFLTLVTDLVGFGGFLLVAALLLPS